METWSVDGTNMVIWVPEYSIISDNCYSDKLAKIAIVLSIFSSFRNFYLMRVISDSRTRGLFVFQSKKEAVMQSGCIIYGVGQFTWLKTGTGSSHACYLFQHKVFSTTITTTTHNRSYKFFIIASNPKPTEPY